MCPNSQMLRMRNAQARGGTLAHQRCCPMECGGEAVLICIQNNFLYVESN
jgi:hypothetical protein